MPDVFNVKTVIAAVCCAAVGICASSCKIMPGDEPSKGEVADSEVSSHIAAFKASPDAACRKVRPEIITQLMTDSFDANTDKKAFWRDEAAKYIAKNLDIFIGNSVITGIGRLDGAVGGAEILYSRGCESPVVKLIHGDALVKQGKTAAAYPVFRSAVAGFQAGDYPPLLVAIAADRLAVSALDVPENETVRIVRNAALNITADYLLRLPSDQHMKTEKIPSPEVLAYTEYLRFASLARNGAFRKSLAAAIAKREASKDYGWLSDMLKLDLACRDCEDAVKESGFDSPAAKKAAENFDMLYSQMKSRTGYPATPYPDTLKLIKMNAVKSFDGTGEVLKNINSVEPGYLPAYRVYIDILSKVKPDKVSAEDNLLAYGEKLAVEPSVSPKLYVDCAVKAAMIRPFYGWRGVFLRPDVFADIEKIYSKILQSNVLSTEQKAVTMLEYSILLAWCGKYEAAQKVYMQIPADKISFQSAFGDTVIPWMPPSKLRFEAELNTMNGPKKKEFEEWVTARNAENSGRAAELFPSVVKSCGNEAEMKAFFRDWEACARFGFPASDFDTPDASNLLIFAVKKGRPDIVRFLIENGEPVSVREHADKMLLQTALECRMTDDITVLLVSRGASADEKCANGNSVLIEAIRQGSVETANRLVDLNAGIDSKSVPDGLTPLHLAVEKNYLSVIKNLIKFNADIYAKESSNGDTALHLAAKKGNIDAVKAIISKGLREHVKNNEGKTAADLARENSFPETAAILDKVKLGGQKRKGYSDN